MLPPLMLQYSSSFKSRLSVSDVRLSARIVAEFVGLDQLGTGAGSYLNIKSLQSR